MDQESATNEQHEATPIFTAYRRGYDPDQVDRFVADQRRRLDDATLRASEAERKLAAAVGQLRELHRRVATLENEDRNPASPPIDAIGERIQRILQEAWDGALAMRQGAESDSSELRDRARQDAEAIIAAARQKAESLGEELARRRDGFLQRIEEERSKTVSQMTFLQGQRKMALEELVKLRTLLDATVEEFSEAPPEPRRQRPEMVRTEPPAAPEPEVHPVEPAMPVLRPVQVAPRREIDPPPVRREPAAFDTRDLPRTIPVHRLPDTGPEMEHDPSELVRSHRAMSAEVQPSAQVSDLDLQRQRRRPALFDFEESEPRPN